jgi:arsenate reductase
VSESVLFLCSHNSARSLMAEALLRHRAGERFDVFSGGHRPGPVNPLTFQVLQEVGIETRGLTSKSLNEFMGKRAIRYAVFVCERTEPDCPHIYPFALQTLYWPFEDPAAVQGELPDRLAAFRKARDEIDARLCEWLVELAERPARGRS